jgi:hypothetical protein
MGLKHRLRHLSSAFLIGLIALVLNTGCAYLMSGQYQYVTFHSSPDGVTITSGGETLGTTPDILTLKRIKNRRLEFTKEGYRQQALTMKTSTNGWLYANAFFCLACVLSTTVDYGTGAVYSYDPNKYYIIMVPDGVTETPAETKKRETRSFILANYRNITAALSRSTSDSGFKKKYHSTPSSSEYVKSLLAILEVPEPDTTDAIDKLKNLSEASGDAKAFSDAVVGEFIP